MNAPPRRWPAQTPQVARRSWRDNPRLILAGILVLLGALAGLLFLANRSQSLSPDFLTEVVLYALSAADLTMLVALAFVLARNVIKLVVERRRALPFARFRGKLVALLLGMTVVPAVLVLIVGSELIRNSVDRWFNAPMDEVLSSASQIASDYYHERQVIITDHANRIARALSSIDLRTAGAQQVRPIITPEIALGRVQRLEVYRVVRADGGRSNVTPLIDVAAPGLPSSFSRASSDGLAAQAASGQEQVRGLERMSTGGELLRAAVVVSGPDRTPAGIVVASDYLSGDLATRSRRMTDAYENYTQLRVLKRPLTGVYLSFFLMVTLMILVGSTWMGLYLAKRITKPVQMLATAAREIGAGHLDHRVQHESADEFGALVEAFNTMAAEIAGSRRRLERSTFDLQRKHQEVESRRRYIETVLDRIGTGVISIDAGGQVTTVNAAAARLLGFEHDVVGEMATDLFARRDLQVLAMLLAGARRARGDAAVEEIALVRDGQEVHLTAMATALFTDGGSPQGTVLVIDDVTPLIRAQRVAAWREVARRLAHEVKNPLTPIQLCAERLGRHFEHAPEPTRALVEECTTTIVGEVESLKALVDEFSRFARMPAPRKVPTDLPGLLESTLALYQGLLPNVAIERAFDPSLPSVRVDPDQIRRVLINLIDNSVEAMERNGRLRISTDYDPANATARIIVSDDGPGIPAGERDKLFMPYYSTKRRGSGLGLAIVQRIIAEHGGRIGVGDETPHGTRFTIDLPLKEMESVA